MINHLIIVRLNNVHKEEQKSLKKYLEHNCWDWKEKKEETIKQQSNEEEDLEAALDYKINKWGFETKNINE